VRFKERLKMAQYFIDTCEKLISVMIIAGVMLAYLAIKYPKDSYGKRSIWVTRAALTAGVILAFWMAIMKNFTNRINTSIWNLWIFILVLASFIVFIFFTVFETKWKVSNGMIPSAALGLQTCLLIFYALPDVLAYPYAIYFTNKTVLSTDFILKTLGVIFGLILSYIAGLGVYKVSRALSTKIVFFVVNMMIIINEIKQVGTAVSILLVKRYISSNHFLFTYAKNVNNYSRLFIYGEMIMAVVLAVTLIVKSFQVNEPYENKAQHRKIKAKWRMNRRWSAEVLICIVLVVFTLTGLETLTSQIVELSPIEDAVIKDGAVCVSFDQVSDGHLHRFGYTTDNGVTIRFIVIKKPNSSSYGIGLDACDICGETGYYEKDDKVVCNLCDVVMNINTIGFKGGCNPIIIDYSISDGYIIVPIDGLLEYESEFK
jgi:uncharacterized membrane protein